MKTKIIGAQTTFPKNRYSQKEIMGYLKQFWPDHEKVVDRFTDSAGVGSRNLVLPLKEYGSLAGIRSRQDAYNKQLTELQTINLKIIQNKIGFDWEDIGVLVSTTITGMMAPSLEALMMNRFPMARDLVRTPIFGLGCLGGVAAINRAHEFLKSRPDKLALVLAHEACSLTFQFNDGSMANMVGSSLFGDGVAAVIIAGENHRLYKNSGLVINETRASFYPDTERIMGWDVVDTGFQIVLSGSVPDIVTKYVAQDLKNVNYNPEKFSFVVSHPGGPKVLLALAEVTGKTKDDFRFSWESLFENGNMSSVSVLNVLEKTLFEGKKSGEQGLMMAMGPAFNSEMTLVTWE